MNKKVILMAALAAVGGVALGILRSPERKGQKAQDLFPQEKLDGYLKNTVIKLVEDGKNGRPILAIATTSFGIKPEQVSPTGYGALLALHRQFPKSNWISVFIAEDSAMADASNWVGMAEFRQDGIVVTGGIPSESELDSLLKMGLPLTRPTPQDLATTAAIFEATGGLAHDRWELSQSLLGAGSGRIDKTHFLKLDLETNALHSVAQNLGMQPKELQATLQNVTRFYWMKAGNPL